MQKVALGIIFAKNRLGYNLSGKKSSELEKLSYGRIECGNGVEPFEWRASLFTDAEDALCVGTVRVRTRHSDSVYRVLGYSSHKRYPGQLIAMQVPRLFRGVPLINYLADSEAKER
jgi:hypothetical protein